MENYGSGLVGERRWGWRLEKSQTGDREKEIERRTEARVRSLLRNSGEVVAICEPNATVRYVSPSIKQVMGYEPEELIGSAGFDYVHPDDQLRVGLILAELLDEPGAEASFELRGRHADGSWRWLEVSLRNLVDDPEIAGLVVNERDVTERHFLGGRAHQTSKLEAVGGLSGQIAHEFGNILAVIQGCAQTISRHPDEVLQDELLQTLLKSADRGSRLTRALLSFARQESFNPQPVNLAELLHATEALLVMRLGKRVELHTEAAEGLWMVMVDRNECELMLLNLASNAADAMEGQGKASITAENHLVDASDAGSTLARGRYVRLTFSDSGAGMTPQVRERMFEPFFTTKSKGEGTGLGLSSVLSMVAKSGGGITVDSEPSRGTAVSVFLPALGD